ncbi:MAG: A24 family peptidase [Thermoguttaceae bacterium]
MLETAFIWIAAAWVAAVGGCIGSFLNVVVYRLPARISLVSPGSHCPRCHHPIRWHDNVPVFGWLLLRGRCRDCRTWIPARYPLVEAAVAVLFLLVAWVEGAALGTNLPVRPLRVVDGWIYPEPGTWQLAGMMGWHLLLLVTLLGASLIRYDGHDVPPRLFLPGLAAGLVGTWIWPPLLPQPAAVFSWGPTPAGVDALVGLAAGATLGWFARRLLEPRRQLDLVWASALAGTLLGWQAALGAGIATIGLVLVSSALARLGVPGRRLSPVAWLGGSCLVWILHWRFLAESLFGLPRL